MSGVACVGIFDSMSQRMNSYSHGPCFCRLIIVFLRVMCPMLCSSSLLYQTTWGFQKGLCYMSVVDLWIREILFNTLKKWSRCVPPIGRVHAYVSLFKRQGTILSRTRTPLYLIDLRAHHSRSDLCLRDSFSCSVVSRVWTLLKSKTEGNHTREGHHAGPSTRGRGPLS